jgi:hypothetical protein
MTKRYIITWAQNNTRPHAAFFAALQHYPAELLVVRGYYRNPTSETEAVKQAKEVAWHPSLAPYLVDAETPLSEKVRLYANIRVSPTASKPLSGFEVLLGKASGVIGHPRRSLRCVASDSRSPRLIATTGAVTVPHYSKSGAGAKARKHHTVGALVVEIRADGIYFVRQVTWDAKTQGFTDLGSTYTPGGVGPAKPAAALVVGDVHWGAHCDAAVRATRAQIAELAPESVVLHDFFDCRVRNHHDKKDARPRHAHAPQTVQSEVEAAVAGLWLFAASATKANPRAGVVVVRSNHDEALDRWAFAEHDPVRDPLNTPYWHTVCSLAYEYYGVFGKFPDLFPMLVERQWPNIPLGDITAPVPKCLKRDESHMVCGIQLGFHGHAGTNGAKGSPQTYSRLGVKAVVGHSHSPWICDGSVGVGHLTEGDMGYAHNPTTWERANCVVYADGKRSLLFIFGERWRS